MAGQEEWTLIYHECTIKGRIELVRLILEDAGVPYVNSSENLYGDTGVCDAFAGSPENVKKDRTPYPVFFPPVLSHKPPDGEEVYINQVFAIMQYLGDTLPGYAPNSAAERARMTHIAVNAIDMLAEGRNSFHPVDNHASYSTQVEEAKVASTKWASERMLTWLFFFEKIAQRVGQSKPIAGCPTRTMADFVLFHVLSAVEAQFNSETYAMAWDKCEVPALKVFKQEMSERPRIKAFLASDRAGKWAGDSMM